MNNELRDLLVFCFRFAFMLVGAATLTTAVVLPIAFIIKILF